MTAVAVPVPAGLVDGLYETGIEDIGLCHGCTYNCTLLQATGGY